MEILKYTLPALIVMATAYFLLKKFLDAQNEKEWAKYNQQLIDKKLPIKLQAYERLMLFCERIDLRNLMLRLSSSGMNVQTLSTSMMIAVQKEFEHNMAQQIYVSDNLWKIISLSKEQTFEMISSFSEKFNPSDSTIEFSKLVTMASKAEDNPLNTARRAIKEEVKLMLK